MKKNIMNQARYRIANLIKKRIPPSIFLLCIGLLVYAPLWFWSIDISKKQDTFPVLPVLGSDSAEYWALSNNLSEFHCFSLVACEPETFRTPGYPLFLVATSFFGSNYFFSTLVQIILALWSGYLVYGLGKNFLSDRVAYYSMVAFVVEPSVVLHSLILLSDIPTLFLLLLSVKLIIDNNKHNILYSGMLLGAATMIRPIFMFLAPLYIIFFIIKHKPIFKTVVKNIILMVFGVCLFVLPWVLRNYKETSVFGISSISAYNLFYYNVPMFLNYKTGESLVDIQNTMISETAKTLDDLKKLENSAEIAEIPSKIIKNDILGYVFFHSYKTTPFFFGSSIKNLFLTWNLIYIKDINYNFDQKVLLDYASNKDWAGFLVSAVENLPIFSERIVWLFCLMFAALAPLTKGNREIKFFLLILILYFAFITGPVSYVRYRLPAEPFLFLLAFKTVESIFLRYQKFNPFFKLN